MQAKPVLRCSGCSSNPALWGQGLRSRSQWGGASQSLLSLSDDNFASRLLKVNFAYCPFGELTFRAEARVGLGL